MNTLDGECLCLREISINVNELLAMSLFPGWLCMRFFILHFEFIPFYTNVVVACLLLYSFFYANVVHIFLFIRWSCKQAHYLCFCSFVYRFKNTIFIFVTICKIILVLVITTNHGHSAMANTREKTF